MPKSSHTEPKPQQQSRVKKVVQEFVIEATNEAFWSRVFEVEKLANMKLKEYESLVIVFKNPETGEETRYDNIRLKPSLHVQN